MLKILVGYDFSAASDAALLWVNQMTEIGKFQARVLYSNWPPDEARRLGYEGPLPLAANPEEIQKNLERDLKKRIARFLPKQKVTDHRSARLGNSGRLLVRNGQPTKRRSDRRRNSPATRLGAGTIRVSVARCFAPCKGVSSRRSAGQDCYLELSSMKTKTSTQTRRARVRPRRTLVPVDFSDSSARALRHAAKRAAESRGSLIILYVVPADYGWLGIGRDELRDLDRSLQRQAADRLRSFCR